MTLESSRLLVAVSTPWASEKLQTPIADMAKRLDADVVVAHVAHPQDEDAEESDAKERAEQTLEVLTDGLKKNGVNAEGVMLFSTDIVKALINTARAKDCSLIVLGVSGKASIKRIIAGDVPSNLIRQADIPVLLCPADWNGKI